MQLAAMGIPNMTLIDDDVVSMENLAVQGFRHSDLGSIKVEATKNSCEQLNPETQVSAMHQRFRRGSVDSLDCLRDRSSKLAVFACVDSMAARKVVWETTRQRSQFFADGRMAGEVVRVLACFDPPGDKRYAATIFDDSHAHPAPCTGRSTLYAASLAGGLMLHRFAMHLRGIQPPADTLLNLLANELTEGV